MHMNLGTSPNPAITGFPPGLVIVPGVVDNAGAAAGQLALTTAYDNAAGRVLNATVPADLTGLTLQGGVYAGPSKAALLLPGTLTLDGAGNPNTVFIFQTNSSLITGSGSTVSLINGAQECNVFWQVLSSATSGSGSTFVGNIFALTSIFMQADVTVHGRALARNGEVTLINDHFTNPTCATSLPATTTTTDGRARPRLFRVVRRRLADDCSRGSRSRCDDDDARSHRRHRRTAAHRCRAVADEHDVPVAGGARSPVPAELAMLGVIVRRRQHARAHRARPRARALASRSPLIATAARARGVRRREAPSDRAVAPSSTTRRPTTAPHRKHVEPHRPAPTRRSRARCSPKDLSLRAGPGAGAAAVVDPVDQRHQRRCSASASPPAT